MIRFIKARETPTPKNVLFKRLSQPAEIMSFYITVSTTSDNDLPQLTLRLSRQICARPSFRTNVALRITTSNFHFKDLGLSLTTYVWSAAAAG